MYSSFGSADTYYVSEEDCTASDLVDDIRENLQKAMIAEYFSMLEDAQELHQILSNYHIRALGVCIQEIASGNFFMPTFQSTDVHSFEGILNSLPQEAYGSTLRGVYSINNKDLLNGSTMKKSASLNTSSGEALSSTSSLSGGVKLTGGGEALPMKPVDEDELRLISFRRNVGEDLVSFKSHPMKAFLLLCNMVIRNHILISRASQSEYRRKALQRDTLRTST